MLQNEDEATQDEFRRMDSLYERTEQMLGEGTYGKVYKAKQKRHPHRVVAMKKMPMDTDEEGLPSTFLREIALLKILKHKHVVELLDIFMRPNKVVLIFEYL